MKRLLTRIGGTVIATLIATMATAGSWTLDGEASHLAFGSVKKDKIGEVHSFGGLSGSASDNRVAVTIDLSSVETNIDIRNERMGEHVFKGIGEAVLNADINMSKLEALAVGQTTEVDVEGTLNLLGARIEVEAEMFVARLSEDRVMVTTNDMIFLSTVDLGVDTGVDKLMELAKLPGIMRAVPITVRLVFTKDAQKAEAAPAAPIPVLVGDVKAGKKVFKKCKACHSLKPKDNKVGPSLHGIIGRAAGSEDFKYSKAMKASGLMWDVETLSGFLAKPMRYLKGTSMSFSGLKKDKDIKNVLAYLADKAG